MPPTLHEIPGSRREAPLDFRTTGRVPADEAIVVSVYLRPKSPAPATPVSGSFESRATVAGSRAQDHAEDCAAIRAFARASGLSVSHEDPARRLVQLSGAASAMEAAFGTELHRYEGDGTACRARHGALHVPAGLLPRITAVLGLDTRPIATPKIVPHKGPTLPAGYLPTEVATLYGITDIDAAGQTIGIIELGGGYTDADNQQAFGFQPGRRVQQHGLTERRLELTRKARGRVRHGVRSGEQHGQRLGLFAACNIDREHRQHRRHQPCHIPKDELAIHRAILTSIIGQRIADCRHKQPHDTPRKTDQGRPEQNQQACFRGL